MFLLPAIHNVDGRLSSQTEIETELLFPRCFRRRLQSWMLELDPEVVVFVKEGQEAERRCVVKRATDG